MLSEEPLLPKRGREVYPWTHAIALIALFCCASFVLFWDPLHFLEKPPPFDWVPPEAAVGGNFVWTWGTTEKDEQLNCAEKLTPPSASTGLTQKEQTESTDGHKKEEEGGGGGADKQCGYPQNPYTPVSDQTSPSGVTDKPREELLQLCDRITRDQAAKLEQGPYKDAINVLLDPTPQNVGTDVYVLFWGALGVCQGHNAVLYYSGGESTSYESPWPYGAKITEYGTEVWNNKQFKRADMPFPLDVMLEGYPHRQNYWEKDHAHFPEVIIKGTNWNPNQKMGSSFSMGAWTEVSNCAWYTTQFLREIVIVLPNHKQWYRRWGPWRPSYVFQALRQFSIANAKIQDANKFSQPEFLYRPDFSEEDLNFYFENSHWISTEIQSLFRKYFGTDPHWLQED